VYLTDTFGSVVVFQPQHRRATRNMLLDQN